MGIFVPIMATKYRDPQNVARLHYQSWYLCTADKHGPLLQMQNHEKDTRSLKPCGLCMCDQSCPPQCHCSSRILTYSYIPTFKLPTFKDGNVCSTEVRCEWNCSLPSISFCWQPCSPTISHFYSLLQPGTRLACSLDGSPVCQLQYWATELFKVLWCKI